MAEENTGYSGVWFPAFAGFFQIQISAEEQSAEAEFLPVRWTYLQKDDLEGCGPFITRVDGIVPDLLRLESGTVRDEPRGTESGFSHQGVTVPLWKEQAHRASAA